METSPIYRLLPAFQERNHVIFLLLGLLSVSQDWMRLLEAEATRTRLHENDPISSPDEVSNRGFLYFLLGTISFTDHFTHALEGAKNRATPDGADDPPATAWEDVSTLLC